MRTDVAATLRRVLLHPDVATSLDVHGATDAAVLVPLYLDDSRGLTVVLTRRRDDLRRHAGEVSFPGGRRDDGETDLRATALREAFEEIGLPIDAVELVGALQPTPTIATSFAIYPFVGVIEPGHAWAPSADEVERVLELTVSDLRSGFARRQVIRRGIAFMTETYVVGEDLVWGATARILGDLLGRLDSAGL